MAVSMGFRTSVSLRPAIQATGPLALAPAGLTPAERVRLRWTHDGMKRLASRFDVVAYAAPQEHLAVNAAERRGQPWTILASTCTSGKARSTFLAEGGEVIERRIRTEPERFDAVLGTRPRARIVIEASTDSEWVARCLEALGHEVIVADPNFAPMYATRTRKVKTDRRDARALAEACLLGAYRPAHRLSDPQRHVRGRLVVRDALVRTRTRYISII